MHIFQTFEKLFRELFINFPGNFSNTNFSGDFSWMPFVEGQLSASLLETIINVRLYRLFNQLLEKFSENFSENFSKTSSQNI